MYLLRNPRPSQRPVQSHCAVVPWGWTARQPAIIAAVQNNVTNESIVMSTPPTKSIGVAVVTRRRINPSRALATRAMNRSSIRLIVAVISGEKNRTPKVVSPQRCVESQCEYAMSGGLLQ